MARVTDGIYRQPVSALRELIANSYDADASWVTVKTDAPRFSEIIVEDDGVGMTPEALIHMLRNIGGSAKRTATGAEIGVTSSADPNTTDSGRQVIGKLGIGLFSVSQLTQGFQIVTKVAGDSFRTHASVRLNQFSDRPSKDDEDSFDAGEYQVWREHAADVDTHGTTIVLDSIRPHTRQTLASTQRWLLVDDTEGDEEPAHPPTYFIGRTDPADPSKVLSTERASERNLPWTTTDSEAMFGEMVDAVWRTKMRGQATPKLAELFDAYLQMLWHLGVALPFPYVHGSLFDEPHDGWCDLFVLSNEPRGAAVRVDEATIRTIGDALPAKVLTGGEGAKDFDVSVDGVRLRRPVRFRDLPLTKHALTRPMVFVGHYRQEFPGIDESVSAGPLEFDAYLFWNPQIAPAEHQGALVRLNGASGTLYDPTFLGYQVAETTRKRQTTCEIFVREGLEGALNIDRESFNTAHPHAVVLTRWVHSAFRQLSNAQKSDAQKVRKAKSVQRETEQAGAVAAVISHAHTVTSEQEAVLPKVALGGQRKVRTSNSDTSTDGNEDQADAATLSLDLDRIQEVTPVKVEAPKRVNVSRTEAIVELLFALDIVDDRDEERLELVAGSILAILDATDD